MRENFYAKLAKDNMVRNRRLFIPHILTAAGFIAVFYIMLTLEFDNLLSSVRGGRYLVSIMYYGVIIVGFLAVVVLLYTNGFLMKQRKSEYGLYHVLGMEKKHVSKILFFESLFSAISSIILGLISGMVLYKICSLIICKILRVQTVLGFYYFSPKTIIPPIVIFGIVFAVAFIINVIQIARMKAIELVKSKNVGEKEPKIRWFFLVTGIATLGAGYIIALVTDNPLQALLYFFIAVLLVIVGTYCLFIAGSIAILKLLKKNKNFYYNNKHMVAVSGMIYRMKQNAVGLASIAVLTTCIVVSLGMTVSLYAGIESTLDSQYQNELRVSYSYYIDGEEYDIPADVLMEAVEDAAKENNIEIDNIRTQTSFNLVMLNKNDVYTMDRSYATGMDILGDLAVFYLITEDEYLGQTGIDLNLADDEIAVFNKGTNKKILDSVLTMENRELKVAKLLDEYPISMDSVSDSSIVPNVYGLVMGSEEVFHTIYAEQRAEYTNFASGLGEEVIANFVHKNGEKNLDTEAMDALWDSMRDKLAVYIDSQLPEGVDIDGTGANWDTRADGEEYYYGLNGSLLFLGLMLSLVFLFATVLIIYYKQISEGYDDRARFQIMEKVGMSTAEVKKTIRNQILLVFFIPLIVAAIHCIVATPMIIAMLKVLFLSSSWLFIGCMAAAFVIFAVIYVIIYSVTAKTYFKIVH